MGFFKESKTIPAITGIGKAIGEKTVTNKDIEDLLRKHRGLVDRIIRRDGVVERLMHRVGIEERRWAGDGQATSDLALEALRGALKMAQIEPQELKALIVGTSSPDYLGVPVAAIIQEKIKSPNVGVYRDVQAACVGFLHSLDDVFTSLTSRLGPGGPQAVVGAEVLSRSIDPSRRETFLLFGDAAGAVIVENVRDKNRLSSRIAFSFGADGRFAEKLYIPAGGSKMPPSRETLQQNLHCMQMDGPLIAENAVKRMVESIEYVLEKVNLKAGEINVLIPHQANREIIEDVAKKLNFSRDRVYINIQRYGNTSAASIPLAMKDAYDEGKLQAGEFVVLCAFGAGLGYGAAVIPMVGLDPNIKNEEEEGALMRFWRKFVGRNEMPQNLEVESAREKAR